MKGETMIAMMQELYEKVSKDKALYEKFYAIIQDGEKAGKEATEAKLITFAKEAGYDVTIEEMQEFFRSLAENNKELSNGELDLVAGGKTDSFIMLSVLSIGIACAMASIEGAQQDLSCDEMGNIMMGAPI